MEFLTTPDLAHAARWAATPGGSLRQSATPRAAAAASVPGSAVMPTVSVATPTVPPSSSSTPHAPPAAAFYAPVDRDGIKNSFQALFSPAVAATPALYTRPASSAAPGLTPFINGLQTPSLVPPGINMVPHYTNMATPHIDPAASPNQNPVLSSPYLQAAAKEAVRREREFMNMPSYVTPNGAPVSGERVVPNKDVATHHQHQQMRSASPATVPTPPHPVPRVVSPVSGDAKVPSTSSPTSQEMSSKPEDPATSAAPLHAEEKHRLHPAQQGVAPQMHQYFMPPQPQPQPHGMVMIGQNGQMMMAAPPGPMYAPPGMMMFAGGQPGAFPQGMMMHAPHTAQMQQPQGQPVKPETQVERKERIELEKQELIREFKKKTREAALVRFRQKRRERRFGKLIRYDCRKKLADARPRVKGRFVRIKDDDDEGMQVVPDLER